MTDNDPNDKHDNNIEDSMDENIGDHDENQNQDESTEPSRFDAIKESTRDLFEDAEKVGESLIEDVKEGYDAISDRLVMLPTPPRIPYRMSQSRLSTK